MQNCKYAIINAITNFS